MERWNCSRTAASAADRIGIWMGDPSPDTIGGFSTAATRFETKFEIIPTSLGRGCGAGAVVTAAFVVVAAIVLMNDCVPEPSSSETKLNVCTCCHCGFGGRSGGLVGRRVNLVRDV